LLYTKKLLINVIEQEMSTTEDFHGEGTNPGDSETHQAKWIASMVFTFMTLPWVAYVTMAMTYYSFLKKNFICISGLDPSKI